MKLLIPLDSSERALQAVEYAIRYAAMLKDAPELVLLNVQWNVAAGHVKLFISPETIEDYYREQGEAALAPARALLESAGLAYRYHISAGTPAETIAAFAREAGIDQILMARQGQGGVQAWLLGSVAHKVLHLVECPVLILP